MTGNVSYLSQHLSYSSVLSFAHFLLFYKLFSLTVSWFVDFMEKMPIKLTLYWPFSNMFTSLSWFSGNSGRAKDVDMSHFFWIIVSDKHVIESMIICGRLDPSFENLLIVVSLRLKENIDCGWVMISCHSLLSPLGLNYQSRRTVRTSNS